MYQDRERQAQKEFKMYRICANYDVICFDYVDDVQVIEHEYFDTYEEALEFERTQTEYEFVSITL